MRVCVFCGASPGRNPAYLQAATSLGQALARSGIGLVYGGAQVGLMGALADGALAEGGEVIGVLPRALQEREVAHPGLTTLHIVDSMHARKAKMSELAEGGYIALPGGLGTLEELFEVWTWSGLGDHSKPMALLNVEGFFDPMLAFLAHVAQEGFLRESYRSALLVDDEIEALLESLRAWEASEEGSGR